MDKESKKDERAGSSTREKAKEEKTEKKQLNEEFKQIQQDMKK